MNSAKETPGLVRALGPYLATAVVVGTVIGSGVFVKPSTVAQNVHFFGPAALVWVTGGILTLLGALTYAEVIALFPFAGGNYVVLREAYGRIFGFLWGWVDFCIIRTASMAALATIFVQSLNDVVANPAFQEAAGLPGGSQLGFWPQKLLAAGVLIALALVNVRGVRWGGGLNFAVTLIKMATLLAILALPFVLWGREADTGGRPDPANLSPAWPDEWGQLTMGGITAALLGVLFAYHGWGNLAPVAEEVRDPGRNLPLALFAGVGIVLLLYLGANLAYALVIPQAEMAEMRLTSVANQFSLRLLGPIGAAFTAAAVMCSAFGAMNGNSLVGPRLLYAMGRDGMLPRAFASVHPSFHTPVLAIMVVGAWAAGMVLFVALLTSLGVLDPKTSHFDLLTDYAMFGSLTFESLGVLSIFVFRWKMPDADRPYRCWGYPIVPALFGLVALFILVNRLIANPGETLTGIAFIGLGVAVYHLAGLAKPGKIVL
jgi:amino acid transporter